MQKASLRHTLAIAAWSAFTVSNAFANIDRAGNVIYEDGSESGYESETLIAFIIFMGIAHYFGERLAFKIAGAILGAVFVIGMLRRFVF
jgi:uncharacterized BrkB/YihY/UPF0761 family membrane protein